MSTYLVIAHECIAHKHYVNAESAEVAKARILQGNYPDSDNSTNRYGDTHEIDTLDWEIVDVQEEES